MIDEVVIADLDRPHFQAEVFRECLRRLKLTQRAFDIRVEDREVRVQLARHGHDERGIEPSAA